MKKLSLTCPVCTGAFHHRVKRSWFLKHALYFLPIKIYYCEHCQKNVYVLMKDQSAAPGEPEWEIQQG